MAKKKSELPAILRGRRILIKEPKTAAVDEKTDSGIILMGKDKEDKERQVTEDLYKKVPVLMVGTKVEDEELIPGCEVFIDTMGLRTAEPFLINGETFMIISEQHVALIW